MAKSLSGKTIVVISPQNWGKMFISKHHYAIELAKKGNRVFFLDPPQEGARKEILVTPAEGIENLWIVQHSLWFPYRLKFHALPIFHWLMGFHISKLLKVIGPIDIVWSFDLGNLYPFRLWGNAVRKVFHPVDEPLNAVALEAAAGADIVFSVTKEILEKYTAFDVPKHFINHGLSADFIRPVDVQRPVGDPVRIGFAGNLLRPDIDREVFLQIVREHPSTVFECWGSYQASQSNIGGGEDDATRLFTEALLQQKNVVLHGVVPSRALPEAFSNMDAFLICYDVQKDQSKGTNYHKVMEFLSTGKVVVANNITTYAQQPDLIQMVSSRKDNRELPGLFTRVINDLRSFNAADKQLYRIEFASKNGYSSQLEKIQAHIDSI